MEDRISKIVRKVTNRRRNILLHGPGGCGKTYTIRLIVRELLKLKKSVACTATTGIAALNMNIPADDSTQGISGSTIHRWGGLGLAREDAKNLAIKVKNNKDARLRWIETEILVIDEVSMFGVELFEKLDYVAKTIRRNELPFGGLILILSGDFLQLPPVKDDWVFLSDAWSNLNLKVFIFDTPKRYDDNAYFDLLLRVRKGTPTPSDIKKLKVRTKAYKLLTEKLKAYENTDEKIIKPTILYSKRVDVDSYNEIELDKLPGDETEFVSDDDFKLKNPKFKRGGMEGYKIILDDSIPEVVKLKIGAQVMLKFNLDVEAGLVNGSRGVVVDIAKDVNIIRVKFLNGRIEDINRITWSYEDKNVIATRTQIPLILSWALTIHKCQGVTLDYAICSLGYSIFNAGQSYVALSRVRSMQGLFLECFTPNKIFADPIALDYVDIIEEYEEETDDDEIQETLFTLEDDIGTGENFKKV